jgi:uncharacterized protein (DUF2252 family)
METNPINLDALAVASWPVSRADPVGRLQLQERSRLAWLLPVRHSRMAHSPFAFFRGAAALMADDLGSLPHSGLEVQLCGDAHLMNFGFYGSPERALLFDLNDFDETVRGPFEWDLKRLTSSMVVAAVELGLTGAWQERLARRCVRSYRKAMDRLAQQSRLEVWHQRIDVDAYVKEVEHRPFLRHLESVIQRARHRDSRQAVSKLCVLDAEGQLRIRHDPPLIWRHAEMDPEPHALPLQQRVHDAFNTYLDSVRPEVSRFLSGYQIVDTASKAVGVGSVGTRCSIGLLVGERSDDVLVLQSKQAEHSVLEPYATSPPPLHHGQRVVEGQRLMQTVSDPFLGWTNNHHHEHLYWRHFRDWKASVEISCLDAEGLQAYGRLCSLALAKAHARSGDPPALAAFMGDGRRFDEVITAFAMAYAKRSDLDYRQFRHALQQGRLQQSPDTPQTVLGHGVG